MKLFFLIILLSVTTASHANENNNYQLLFHQGADAKGIEGSIDKLMKAIRDGKQIRLYMNLGFVEHSMDAGFISIFEGNVYAQIDAIQAQRPNRQTKEIEMKPYAKHIGLYSTKSPYEIKWFSF
jgi:hypothetical protein